MQEKPPFSSYLDFFSNVCEGPTPSHTHPLRTFILSSGTPLAMAIMEGYTRFRSKLHQNDNSYNMAFQV